MKQIMRNRITDIVGVLSMGLLLTTLVVGTYSLLRSWHTHFFFLGGLCIPPVLAVLHIAKRTSLNPVLAGIATCLIPALAYFAFKYAWNVYIKVTYDDGSTFLNIGGYVDPYDFAGNLRMAATPCVWAFVTGSVGAALHFFVERKNDSNNAV